MRSSTTVTWLRLACTVSANPFGVPGGTLMLRNVRGGSPSRSTSSAIVAAAAADGPKSYVPARALERHGDARHPEQRPFQRARHGPRIRHVVAEVVALVDAGHDEIRQAVANSCVMAMLTQSVGVPSTS